MRKGVNTLCGEVRRVGLDPTNGDGTSTTTRAAAAEQSPGHSSGDTMVLCRPTDMECMTISSIRPGMNENQIVALLPYNCKTELR